MKDFLEEIRSRNNLWKTLREKERLYAKLIQMPECVDECQVLHDEILGIKSELGI